MAIQQTMQPRTLVNGKGQELVTHMTEKEAFNKLEGLVQAGWDDKFPTSLIRQGNSDRGLTENQFWWIHKLAIQGDLRCQIVAGNISGRMHAALLAGVRLRDLKHEMHTPGGLVVRLSMAGERSRSQGTIWVMDGGKYPDNTLYGRIDQATGVFHGDCAPAEVQQLLRDVQDNPDAYLPW